MRIIIDGDATSGIAKIESIAKKYKIECTIFCDYAHIINSSYSEIIQVSTGFQSVDMAILPHLCENDILITQDYGLASLGLSKNCYVIHPRGMEYTNDNIDILLQNRYFNLKQKRKIGPKKRTKEDEIKLLQTLERIIGEGK